MAKLTPFIAARLRRMNAHGAHVQQMHYLDALFDIIIVYARTPLVFFWQILFSKLYNNTFKKNKRPDIQIWLGTMQQHTHSHSHSSCSYNKLKKETNAKKQQTQRPAHKDFFAHHIWYNEYSAKKIIWSLLPAAAATYKKIIRRWVTADFDWIF